MAKLGLTRLPFYKELTLLTDNKVNNKAFVLSILLYWCSKDLDKAFNIEANFYQIAINLNIDPKDVLAIINELIAENILYKVDSNLYKKEKKYSENDVRKSKEKESTYLKLNFRVLFEKLKDKGATNLSTKILKHSADDFFDLYDIINDKRLPFTQTLIGKLSYEQFNKASIIVAKILSYVVANHDKFARKALAPGWHMLLLPPATYFDIASRFLKEDERAIDIGFTDGSFFMPCSSTSNSNAHHICHNSNKEEPKILMATIMLALNTLFDELTFISDFKVKDMQKSFELLHEITGLVGILKEDYYKNLDLSYNEEQELKRQYQNICLTLIDKVTYGQ